MGKLVRDLVPDLIRAEGKEPQTKVLDFRAFRAELKNKLVEEANEVKEARQRFRMLDELADTFEVLDAICVQYNFSQEEITAVQTKRRVSRGGFKKRLYLK